MFVLALFACQVEIAPVPEAEPAAGLLVRTALGDQVTLTAPEGVTGFGAELAVIRGDLVVTETAEGDCPHRLRSLSLSATDLVNSTLVSCPTPGDLTFGTSLSGADEQTVTGDQALRYTTADGLLSDQVPAVFEQGAFDATATVLDGWRTMVGTPSDGLAGAVHAFVRTSSLRVDHTLPTPDGLEPGAGFGSKVHASYELLVAETRSGHPTFYAPVATSWKHWELIDGPEATRVHALVGNEILVEQEGTDDLVFFTYDGSWSESGRLVDARGTASSWAFDRVAAFGARSRTVNEPGAVDRYVRDVGLRDASIALLDDHSSVELTLMEGWLAVSEPGDAGGQLHVFDWTDDRNAFFADLGGHQYEICQLVPESTLDEPLELADHATEDGFYAFGDVGGEGAAYYRMMVPARSSVSLTMGSPWGGPGAFDVNVLDSNGVGMDFGALQVSDGLQRRRWDNFRDTPQELVFELEVDSPNSERGCRAFDFNGVVSPLEADYCIDGFEVADGASDPRLIDVVGYELYLQGDERDVYEVSLQPDVHMRISLQHELSPRNIKMRLRDATGSILSFGGGDVILYDAIGYERLYLEVEFQDDAPGVCGTYVLDVNLTSE